MAPATGALPEGIAAQAEQSCKNVGAILEAAGVGFENVVKTTCFLADIADFAAFNEVYARYFTSKPARSCVAVKELPKKLLCEIESVAVCKEDISDNQRAPKSKAFVLKWTGRFSAERRKSGL